MAKNEEFYVMPNSGHHYLFVPLEGEQLKEHPGIEKKCDDESVPWQQCKEYSWIRYRLGKYSDGKPGIWIVVETNLGTVKRGRLFGDGKEREVLECFLPPEGIRNKTPYAFENDRILSTKIGRVGGKEEKKDSMKVEIIIPDGEEKPTRPVVPKEQARSEEEKPTPPTPIHVTLEIIWQRKNPSPIDVDLVVDFGNTRTVVFALEDDQQTAGDGLYSVCKPVPFLPRGHEYSGAKEYKKDQKDQVIADSWFLLQEPLFYEYDVPPKDEDGGRGKFRPSQEYTIKEVTIEKGWGPWKRTEQERHYYVTERIPQMFVEIAPAIMGKEAGDLLSNNDLERGENLSMSSPKRYLWDTDILTAGSNSDGIPPWSMNHNSWATEHSRRDQQFYLSGQICLYMYNGKDNDWDIEHPPFENKDATKRPRFSIREAPGYPRRTAMMWSALYVLESAYRQITSYNWRKGNSDFTARRLRSVHVTYPPGWITAEREAYRKAWEQAINVFTLAHFESRAKVDRENATDARPELHMELDEAVASQLPFIYSEVRRLEGANAWIALYGRPHGKKHRVRVMTIDIGGGTMDTSIVEYRNNAPDSQVALKYRVIFRDSNTFAGDSVVLSIIQRVLLPAMLRARGIEDAENEDAKKFANVLRKQRSEQKDRAKWQRITKMLFIPIVRQWLSDVVSYPGGHYKEGNKEFRAIRGDTKGGDMKTDEHALKDFIEYLKEGGLNPNFVKESDQLMYKTEEINKCIEEGLGNGITPLGKFVAAYDVDVVTLSGKITEMPKVVEMLHQKLPICAQRIIPMKDYVAGDWYPMGEDGRIADAKTVTAVGAALFTAGRNGLIKGWMLSKDEGRDEEEREATSRAMRNYWGILKKGKNGVAYGFSGEPILKRDEDTNEARVIEGTDLHGVSIMPGYYIGRAKYNTKDTCVEQQYYFRMRDKDRKITSPLAVVFVRKSDGEDDDIEIKSVRATDPDTDGEVTESDVELALHTLKEGGFWMDECRFEVEMSAE